MKNYNDFEELKTDQAAIDEVANIDLSEYDLSNFKPMRFEFQKKSARLELRIPEEQLDELKELAEEKGIPHTRLVRFFIERGMQALQR